MEGMQLLIFFLFKEINILKLNYQKVNINRFYSYGSKQCPANQFYALLLLINSQSTRELIKCIDQELIAFGLAKDMAHLKVKQLFNPF